MAEDISGGAEAIPVPAVNEVDKALPPCVRPASVLELRAKSKGVLLAGQLSDEELAAADAGWRPEMCYVTAQVYAQGVAVPLPGPGCGCSEGCTSDKKCGCALATPALTLPYVAIPKSKRQPQLIHAMPCVFECGPSCACPPSCPNRVTQQGLRWRLEVFRTHDGARSADPPKQEGACRR